MSQQDLHPPATRTPPGSEPKLSKGRAAALIALVAVALLCLLGMIYATMHATPHMDPAIQKAPHHTRLASPLPARTVHS